MNLVSPYVSRFSSVSTQFLNNFRMILEQTLSKKGQVLFLGYLTRMMIKFKVPNFNVFDERFEKV